MNEDTLETSGPAGALARIARRVTHGAATCALLSGCVWATDPVTQGNVESEEIRWVRPTTASERASLDRWASAVGPPVVASSGVVSAADRVDSFAILSWNTHVGGGSAGRLIADLRAGRLTGGEPIDHFALLLQEVHRTGNGVPDPPPRHSETASRIREASSAGERIPVDALARREGLHLYYVPSMRNGTIGSGEPEDRGNAILSTLPLSGLLAVELPLERQRRVAVAASVGATRSGGEPWTLQLVSVHLDQASSWRNILRSFGAGRLRQVEWLIGALEGEQAVAIGGDFNTWMGGNRERAIDRLHASFPVPASPPDHATVDALLPDRSLDHLFFRIPEGWTARYRMLEDEYGSDHRPLLGRVDVAPEGTNPR
jgi:endonuclease/exonuclease/phosphatase family metal-dependent hydrolase